MKTFNHAIAIKQLVARLHQQDARPAPSPCAPQLSLHAPSFAERDSMHLGAPGHDGAAVAESPRGVRIFDMS